MSRLANQSSDEEIIQMVQSGDLESFGVLVKRYEAKMLRYARKFLFNYEDAEDLVQNVFLKAYTNIQGFDISKKFPAWLYRIAHNEFINAIKKKGKEPLPLFDIDILFPHFVVKEDINKKIDEKEMRQFFNGCFEKLGPKYREPLILYYFEELTYKEIADVLRIPISTVGIRLNRAKKTMRSLCQKLDYRI